LGSIRGITKQNKKEKKRVFKQNFSKQINLKQTSPQLRVYVANLSKYNQGELCGNWLNLPTSNNQIKTFLKHQVKLHSPYEEYALHDYESDFNHTENENLYDLNILAIKLEQMRENEKALAAAYCNANGLKDTLSILNICEQINDISYVEPNFPEKLYIGGENIWKT